MDKAMLQFNQDFNFAEYADIEIYRCTDVFHQSDRQKSSLSWYLEEVKNNFEIKVSVDEDSKRQQLGVFFGVDSAVSVLAVDYDGINFDEFVSIIKCLKKSQTHCMWHTTSRSCSREQHINIRILFPIEPSSYTKDEMTATLEALGLSNKWDRNAAGSNRLWYVTKYRIENPIMGRFYGSILKIIKIDSRPNKLVFESDVLSESSFFSTDISQGILDEVRLASFNCLNEFVANTGGEPLTNPRYIDDKTWFNHTCTCCGNYTGYTRLDVFSGHTFTGCRRTKCTLSNDPIRLYLPDETKYINVKQIIDVIRSRYEIVKIKNVNQHWWRSATETVSTSVIFNRISKIVFNRSAELVKIIKSYKYDVELDLGYDLPKIDDAITYRTVESIRNMPKLIKHERLYAVSRSIKGWDFDLHFESPYNALPFNSRNWSSPILRSSDDVISYENSEAYDEIKSLGYLIWSRKSFAYKLSRLSPVMVCVPPSLSNKQGLKHRIVLFKQRVQAALTRGCYVIVPVPYYGNEFKNVLPKLGLHRSSVRTIKDVYKIRPNIVKDTEYKE
jgi:hypothetical protein